MIDVSEFSFDLPAGGVTVYYDVLDGFCLLGLASQGAKVGICIAESDTMDGRYFDEETTRHRLFLGSCRIEVDPASAIDAQTELRVGALIIGKEGTTVLARGNIGRGPAFVGIVGKPIGDRYEGFAFSRWSIVRDRPGQAPAVIFQYETGPLLGEA